MVGTSLWNNCVFVGEDLFVRKLCGRMWGV